MNKKPQISSRGENTPFSPIRKFVPLLEEIKAKGVKVYELHIGQPDLKTPSKILEKVKSFSQERLSYTASPGTLKLRGAWREYYKKSGIDFKISEIVSTVGASEGILFAFSAVCDPQEELLVFEPLYTTYNSYAAMTDVKLNPVTTKPETGFHLPPLKKIEEKVTQKTKGVLICNPNNPTGTVYSSKELKTIAQVARKHNLFIIADETYRQFVYGAEKHHSIVDFPKAEQRSIILDSVSKGFSACGARIGCLASKNKGVIETVTKFAQARLSLPMVEQEAVIPLLKNPKNYINQIVPEYRKRRDTAFQELQKIEGIRCQKPHGAFYIIVSLPVDNSEVFTKWMLKDFSWKGSTVMLSPASGFYATPGLGKNEVRIAFVLSAPKIKKAIQILKKGLQAYKKNV